jgi:hypothetical protein
MAARSLSRRRLGVVDLATQYVITLRKENLTLGIQQCRSRVFSVDCALTHIYYISIDLKHTLNHHSGYSNG